MYPRPSQDDATLVYPVAQYDHDEGSAVSAGFLGIDTAGELYLPGGLNWSTQQSG